MTDKVRTIILKLLMYTMLEGGLLFTLYLFSTDYKQFSWYVLEGLKYLHFISTVSPLLIGAFLVGFLIKRERGHMFFRYFPLVCFLLIPVYMFADGGSLGGIKMNVGKGMAIGLFLFSIYVIITDFRRNKSQQRHITRVSMI